ncbi:hypothetical protein RMI40_31305 [Pseudomonas protegens]|uniref:hypothetical protein n=1 Tax=Pseudomonas protegens TaxID=380021 RepID=UPI00287DB026|nr:hypothetical protein [Pseudomonas protegens]MDS9879326.1 hypothetical protein [Pseudomonas protegens]
MPTETQLEQRVAALQSDLNERDQRIDDLEFSDNDRELSRRSWFDEAKRLEKENEGLRAKLAQQVAPAAPDGYCIMPRHLTAENGAKALLLGEFKLQSTHDCPECRELEEPSEGCEICDGEGEYGQKHTIPWDQIKFIYSKAVEGLAVKAEPAKF